MIELNHLHALEIRLSNERLRYTAATGSEKILRGVWVAGIEKEISDERANLGIPTEYVPISDDELLSQLGVCP
jgi:hypothetical protein